MQKLRTGTLVFLLLLFHLMADQTTDWPSFFFFLVLDCGISILGIVLLLHRRPFEALMTVSMEGGSLLPTEDTALLLENDNNDSTVLFHASTNNDPALRAHTVVFLVVLLTLWWSDCFAILRDATGASVAFVSLDLLQNFFYGIGFLVAAVSYRLIAIRIWGIYDRLEEEYHGGDLEMQQLLITLSDAVSSYESTYRVAEHVSARTSTIVATMILLLAVKMVTALRDVVREQELDFDSVAHLAQLRLILALGALILQTVLAAADIVYASERLAEVLASLETSLQVVVADGAQQQAHICRTLGTRVRHHPIRMRISWLHFHTKWAMGLCALVLIIFLAVVGGEK